MKQAEKDAVNALYSHYNYRCFLHEAPANQRAHIIGDTKLNRKVHGAAVIDNPLNWLPACNLDCNKKCDIGFIKSRQDEIAGIINSSLPEDCKRDMIGNIILEKNGLFQEDINEFN